MAPKGLGVGSIGYTQKIGRVRVFFFNGALYQSVAENLGGRGGLSPPLFYMGG